jgi:hypothetical protein
MTYNRYSLELMAQDDEDEWFVDVIELSNGKLFMLELESLEF